MKGRGGEDQPGQVRGKVKHGAEAYGRGVDHNDQEDGSQAHEAPKHADIGDGAGHHVPHRMLAEEGEALALETIEEGPAQIEGHVHRSPANRDACARHHHHAQQHGPQPWPARGR